MSIEHECETMHPFLCLAPASSRNQLQAIVANIESTLVIYKQLKAMDTFLLKTYSNSWSFTLWRHLYWSKTTPCGRNGHSACNPLPTTHNEDVWRRRVYIKVLISVISLYILQFTIGYLLQLICNMITFGTTHLHG